MGMVKATNAAIAPIENRAPAASSPPKISTAMAMPTAVLNHTALTGVRVWRFTRLVTLDSGPKQSSREYANVTREAATLYNRQLGLPSISTVV